MESFNIAGQVLDILSPSCVLLQSKWCDHILWTDYYCMQFLVNVHRDINPWLFHFWAVHWAAAGQVRSQDVFCYICHLKHGARMHHAYGILQCVCVYVQHQHTTGTSVFAVQCTETSRWLCLLSYKFWTVFYAGLYTPACQGGLKTTAVMAGLF